MDQFAINQNGLVTVKHDLDRETVALHIIHILAIDNPTSKCPRVGGGGGKGDTQRSTYDFGHATKAHVNVAEQMNNKIWDKFNLMLQMPNTIAADDKACNLFDLCIQ